MVVGSSPTRPTKLSSARDQKRRKTQVNQRLGAMARPLDAPELLGVRCERCEPASCGADGARRSAAPWLVHPFFHRAWPRWLAAVRGRLARPCRLRCGYDGFRLKGASAMHLDSTHCPSVCADWRPLARVGPSQPPPHVRSFQLRRWTTRRPHPSHYRQSEQRSN